jgi:mono/diheme cytochrome c family protein
MKTTLSVISIIVFAIFIAGFTRRLQNDPWIVPANEAKKKNPVPVNKESLAEGKTLWDKHCASCHGKTGMGDGTKSKQLKTTPGDFTRADVQSQTDGSIFYKTSEGRKDMPSFKKKIPDADDIWSIVNYVRTFKK